MTEKHTYPSNYGPDHADPFVRVSWWLMDSLSPDAMAVEARIFLAGMIASTLSEAYQLGKQQRSPEDMAAARDVGKTK